MVESSRLSLTEVGLSADADLAWRVLIRAPDLSLADLAATAGLSRAAAAAVVGELGAAGLLRRADVALGWVPVEPTVAVEQRIAAEQRQLAERLSSLSAMRADLADLSADFSRGCERLAPRMEMEILTGLENIRTYLAAASTNAKVEILSMMTRVSMEGLECARPVDFGSLARGVAGRTLVDSAALDDPDRLAYFEALSAVGEKTRAVPTVPARMLIYDREFAVLPVDASDIGRAAVVVRAHTIVGSLVFLFEQLWADAAPLFVPAHNSDRPDGRSARVLELLAMGRKDESIARSLGVGVRTVRRDVAELMTALGEKTRPATVAAAIRRGWLTTEPETSAGSVVPDQRRYEHA